MRDTRSPTATTLGVTRASLILFALGLLLTVASGCRSAPYSEEEDYLDLGRFTYPGVNIGGGLTKSLEDFDLAGGVSADDTSGFHVRFGVRGSRYLAFEIMHERSLDFDTNSGSTDYTTDAISANLKVYPTGGFDGNAARLQPYLSAGGGVFFINADVPGGGLALNRTNHDFGGLFRYAGGLDFYLVENVLLSAEYARIMPTASRLDDFEYDNLNFGLQFRF